MAVWAAGALMNRAAFGKARETHLPNERDDAVRADWLQNGGTA
jgi:hypothetical protein